MNRYICLPLAWSLRRAGFTPYLFGYSSVHDGIEANAACLANFVAGIPEDTVHFVAHSLGGLVTLEMLSKHKHTRQGRAVLLGSPIRGSFLAHSLAKYRFGKWLVGPSLIEWNPPPLNTWTGKTEVGVIAGSIRLGMAMFFSSGLPLPNDGAVAVEETQLLGLKAHLVLPVSHTGMLVSSRVMRETATFLRTGEF